jgi:hypothetical protein
MGDLLTSRWGASLLDTVRAPRLRYPATGDRAPPRRVSCLTVRALLDQLSREVADSAAIEMEQAVQQMSQQHQADSDGWDDDLAEGRIGKKERLSPSMPDGGQIWLACSPCPNT